MNTDDIKSLEKVMKFLSECDGISDEMNWYELERRNEAYELSYLIEIIINKYKNNL